MKSAISSFFSKSRKVKSSRFVDKGTDDKERDSLEH